jgi:C2 domain
MKYSFCVVIVCMCVLSYVTIDTHARSMSKTELAIQNELTFELPVHRQVCLRAYNAVSKKMSGHKTHTTTGDGIGNDSGFWKRFKQRADTILSTSLSFVGSALSSVYGSGSDDKEAHLILSQSSSILDMVSRVNLRLGVTYPDVPTSANKPILVSSFAAKSQSTFRMFGFRHILSLFNPSSTHDIAASHEGDRQYWHSMINPTGNPTITNEQVRKDIIFYIKDLYHSSKFGEPETRWWYYGRIIHCIQDSYSQAHVARDIKTPGYPIRFFQDYGKQQGKLHAVADSAPLADLDEIRKSSSSSSDVENAVYLRKALLSDKQKLYTRMLAMTRKFLEIVWDDDYRPYTTRKGSKWGEIDQFLNEEVFVFDSPKWRVAMAGGTLPGFAVDGEKGREMDQSVPHRATEWPLQMVDGFPLEIEIIEIQATGLKSADMIGHSDPFVEMFIEGKAYQTAVADDYSKSNAAIWTIGRKFYAYPFSSVTFKLYDSDTLMGVPSAAESEHLGTATYNLQKCIVPGHPGKIAGGTAYIMLNRKPHGSLIIQCRAVPNPFALGPRKVIDDIFATGAYDPFTRNK